MKINKKVLIEENDDGVEGEDLAEINPQTASVSDIAAGLQASIEDQTADTKTLSDAKATQIAAEVKQTAKEVDAGGTEILPADDESDDYITNNRLTEVLDQALRNASRFARLGQKIGANVLITGLPGSGKTAIVDAWARRHPEIKLVRINAKNNKLETAIDGMPMRVQGTNEVAFLPTDLLKPLTTGKCVLFLDEFNRQTNAQIRGALLTLINEKRTAGYTEKGGNGFDFSKTLLFTIACINPSVRTDRGAAPLNDAERSRFIFNINDFDSDLTTWTNYMDTTLANDLVKKFGKNLSAAIETGLGLKKRAKGAANITPEQEDDLLTAVKIYDLAHTIAENPNFALDTKDDLDDIYDEQKQLLNNRLLTDAIYNAEGNVDKLRNWVKNYSNMLDRDIQMLLDVLKGYKFDKDAVYKSLGLLGEEALDKAAEQGVTQNTSKDNTEADAGLFNTANSGKTAASMADAEKAFTDLMQSW